ncbi:Zinc finger transcription factor ace1 protein [Rutstroemia sp. NJR-2017a BVV2]|nr:Zinc finger transcription factor ace1 protein [Rutstroemia sp. NJR-2017a BVV2]PQE18503.1 Zinc finger transcription factor ace1 protein [Rutstroemia sp. NJR-2017a BVV2]
MSFTNPRRTSKTSVTPSLLKTSDLPTVNTAMVALRKGATFHSPTSPSVEESQPFQPPTLVRRSASNLEYVTVDAYKRRAAESLVDIDRTLAAVELTSPSSRQSFRDESDPLPKGVIASAVDNPATAPYPGTIMEGPMTMEPSSRRSLRSRRRPNRYADSGLGTSIGSSSEKKEANEEEESKPVKTASAITRSAAASSTTVENLPRLSARASNRITEHILRPLLSKSSLREFRPLVKDIPNRIHKKEIVCLRDLEKTLIFRAPVSNSDNDVVEGGVAHWFSRLKEKAKTASLYLDFCLTSIHCIQATVELLSEREQVRPHDRPYTNGYFIDLTEQIKQYAREVQAAKEKEEKGEALEEMEAHPYVSLFEVLVAPSRMMANYEYSSDEIKLHGGLTKNGRPAELVRIRKDGKAISMATGKPVDIDEDENSAMKMKRSLSDEDDDDESVFRSMARRKKDASAAELAPKFCREPGCGKFFKRPCDLTKHVKTHSRPWKCAIETCKYHTFGWPTEKEMDRHHNDKHSSAPALYECHFKPCPYRSKRESNCKQHMEKAHGWQYVRSKNNGKNRPAPSAIISNGLPTPQATVIRTPSDSNLDDSPIIADDMMYENTSLYSSNQGLNFFPQLGGEYPREIEMYQPPQQLNIEYSPVTDGSYSLDGQSPFDPTSPFNSNSVVGAQDQFQENMQTYSGSNEWAAYEETDLYSAQAQVQIPQSHIYQQALAQTQFQTSGATYEQAQQLAQISPIGEANTMLFTPKSMQDFDDGFEDFVPANSRMSNQGAGDFQLFSSSAPQLRTMSHDHSPLFGEIPQQSMALFGVPPPQELLAFYAQSAANSAAGNSQRQQNYHQMRPSKAHHQQQIHQNLNMGMDWSSDDASYGYSDH